MQKNGFSDVISVIHSTIEDATLPVECVDIIVSEWMGFYLLHESMLSSVIFARDKWLRMEGMMIPSGAKILMCPANIQFAEDQTASNWKKLYDFDLSPLTNKLKEKHLQQPQIQIIKADQLLSTPEIIAQVDVRYVDTDEIQRISKLFKFQSNKNSLLNSFAVWFECLFENQEESNDAITTVLDTGPHSSPTHWKQTVIHLPEALLISKEEEVSGIFELHQDVKNPRMYNITVALDESPENSDDECDLEDTERTDDVADMIMQSLHRDT